MTTPEPHACPDCGVLPGDVHEDGCDVARCLATGHQRLSCGGNHPRGGCGRDVWTGQWPGAAECAEYGFWSYFAADYGTGTGWVRCAAGDPRGSEDLNRLTAECSWDPRRHRWVRRDPLTAALGYGYARTGFRYEMHVQIPMPYPCCGHCRHPRHPQFTGHPSPCYHCGIGTLARQLEAAAEQREAAAPPLWVCSCGRVGPHSDNFPHWDCQGGRPLTPAEAEARRAPRVTLTAAQAVAMLPGPDPEEDLIRVVTNPAAGLRLAADWTRDSVTALIRSGEPSLAGPAAAATGHGLAVVKDGSAFFIQTRPATERPAT